MSHHTPQASTPNNDRPKRRKIKLHGKNKARRRRLKRRSPNPSPKPKRKIKGVKIPLPPTPDTLTDPQWHELTVDSGIDFDIARLNWENVGKSGAWSRITGLLSKEHRRNDGRVRDWVINKYSHLDGGGLWCSGRDPLNNFKPMEWGQLKPNTPRESLHKPGKSIKYEACLKADTRSFWLRVPRHVWERIAKRAGVAMPEVVVETEIGEALGFWSWVLSHPEIPVFITEGAKKAGALLTVGYAAIALPGVTNWGDELEDGRRVLRPDLQTIVASGREIYIAYDKDKKWKTIRNVNSQTARMGAAFNRLGCKVKVCHWNAIEGKGADDFLVNGGDFSQVVKHALELEKWRVMGLRLLTYARNIIIQQGQKYIGDIPLPKDEKLVGIRAPKDTGKTETIARWIELAQAWGIPALVITHRIQLAKALAERFGIDHVQDIQTSDTKGIFGYALCIDSLREGGQRNFVPESWGNALVIIDECEQVLWHLLNSNTEVGTYRIPILETLSRLFTAVFQGSGKIILSDADLSDLSIDFVKKHAPKSLKLEPFIIESCYVGGGYEAIFFTEGKPDVWFKTLVKSVKAGERPLVFVGGQKATSKWGTINVCAKLQKVIDKQFGDDVETKPKILRVDAETVADPTHAAYHISKHTERMQGYEIVVCSPTLETGVSIDFTGHFTSVWLASFGNQTTDAVRQALKRLREPVPRYIWTPNSASGRIGCGSISPKRLLDVERKKAYYSLKFLKSTDLSLGFDETEGYQWLWAKYAARINYGFKYYRDTIRRELENEGNFAITFEPPDEDIDPPDDEKDISTQMENVKQESWDRWCDQRQNARQLSEEGRKKLADKREKTPDEMYALQRANLAALYGEDNLTKGLIKYHDKGGYAKLRLRYALTVGKEFVAGRDRSIIESLLDRGGGKCLPWDVNGKSRGWEYAVFEAMGAMPSIADIQETIATSEDGLIRSFDPVIERFRQRAQRLVKEFFELGIPIAEADLELPESGSKKDVPVTVFNKFARKVGLPLRRCGRDGSGDRQYQYTIEDEMTAFCEGVFAYWREQDIEKRNARLQALEDERQRQEQARLEAIAATQAVTESPPRQTAWTGLRGRLTDAIENAGNVWGDMVRSLSGKLLEVVSEPYQNLGRWVVLARGEGAPGHCQWAVPCEWILGVSAAPST